MTRPALLTTWPFGLAANESAWAALRAGGASLDAALAVCRHVENDEAVESVGFGGMPDASGAMTLDGCVMQSPARCGSVCAVRRHRHPCEIARLVMEKTSHVMLVGREADDFADEHGLASSELLSASARRKFEARGPAPHQGHDTVCVLALDSAGVLSGSCSTSGRAFKLPGRVGDSPIIGAGLYVDPRSGGAAATGSGELVLGLCSSFLAVELMRRGASPEEALVEAVSRIRDEYELQADDQIGMIAMTPRGEWSSCALRPDFHVAYTDDESSAVHPSARVLLGA